MAGENVLPLVSFANHPPLTVHYTAAADGSKGDVVTAGGRPAFLLADVEKDAAVEAAVHCKLVQVPKPDTEAWAAGQQAAIGGVDVGMVFRDAAEKTTRAEVIWGETLQSATGGYLYFEMLNARTTPVFGMTAISSNTAVAATGDGYTISLLKHTVAGLTPGAPLCVDYEGDILCTPDANVNIQFAIGYTIYPDDPAKKATNWRSVFRGAGRNEEIGVGMDAFSAYSLFGIGSPVPPDADPTTPYMLAADDFVSLPVEVTLRIQFYNPNSLTVRFPQGTRSRFKHLEIMHPQVVSHQIALPS